MVVAGALRIVALALAVMMVVMVLVLLVMVMLMMMAMLVLLILMVMVAAVLMAVLVIVVMMMVMLMLVVAVIVVMLVMMVMVLGLLGLVLGPHLLQQLVGQRHLFHGGQNGLTVQLVPGVVRMAAVGFFSRSRATAASSFSWVSFWVRDRMMVPADSIWLL